MGVTCMHMHTQCGHTVGTLWAVRPALSQSLAFREMELRSAPSLRCAHKLPVSHPVTAWLRPITTCCITAFFLVCINYLYCRP